MNEKELIKILQKNKIDPVQIVTFTGKSIEVKVLNDKTKMLDASNDTGYDITARYKDRDVKVSTNYLSEEIIDTIKEKVKYIEIDEKELYIEEKKKIDDVSPKIDFDISKEITEILEGHKERKKDSRIKDIETGYYVNTSSKRIVNSYGLDIFSQKNLCSIYTEVTTKEKDNLITTDDFLYSSKKDMDIKKFITNVIDEAISNINKKTIKSGKYNLLLSPRFVSAILGEFSHLLSKEAIRKKDSCLDGKLNKKIFNEKVTIIEDPSNKKYPNYSKFDNEGTTTYKKTIIDKGVLKTYLYNNREALLDKTKSTGNGYNGIGVNNFILLPGKKTEEDLLKELGDGLYISQYFSTGGTTLDGVTGDFSAQITGSIVKDGKKKETFETSILTTTIYELFSNIEDISNKIEFKKLNVAAPYILVKDISISSN